MTPEEINARLAANSDELGFSRRSKRIAKLIDRAVSREIRRDVAHGDDGKEAVGDIMLGAAFYLATVGARSGLSARQFAAITNITVRCHELILAQVLTEGTGTEASSGAGPLS